jgi:lipopolysaccharide exporter
MSVDTTRADQPDATTPAAPSGNTGLRAQAMRGMRWTYGATLIGFACQLAYTAQISRVLPAAAFGLVALGGAVLRFGTFFAQLGLGQAVVQKPDLDERDIRVAFTLSSGLGFVFFALVWLIAPGVETAFAAPGLAGTIRGLGGGFAIAGLGAVGLALLRRRFRFRALAATTVSSYVVGYLIVGLACARAGLGVASLVIASLVQFGIQTTAALALTRHSVVPHWDRHRARRLSRFGGLVSVIGFLSFLNANLDTFAIGRLAGAATLGQYNRAILLAALPAEQLSTSASKVIMPVLSRLQDDRDHTAQLYGSALALLLGTATPASAALAVVAVPVVALLFGPGWTLAASLVPYVVIATCLASVTHLPAVLAEARDRLPPKLVIGSIQLIVTLVLVAIAATNDASVHQIALAWVTGLGVQYVLFQLFTARELEIDARSLLRVHGEALLLSAVPAAAMVGAQRVAGVGAAGLVVTGLIGAVTYAALIGAMPGLASRQAVRDLHLGDLVLRRRVRPR